MLNENIHALLRQNKLTMRQLSIKSGVPFSTLQSMLSASDNCRVKTLLAAYHAHPDLQPAVDRLLGVVRQKNNETAGDYLADVLSAFTQAAAISK